MGRLNRVGSPIFYCSAGEPPVFSELNARVGDTIVVSECEVLEPLWLHNLGFHEDALVKLGVPFIGSRPDLTNAIPDETTENERLRRKFSLALAEDVAAGDEYKYKLSVAINELLFDKADQSRSAKVDRVLIGRRGRCIRAFNLTLAQITWLFSLNLWTAVFKSGSLSTVLLEHLIQHRENTVSKHFSIQTNLTAIKLFGERAHAEIASSRKYVPMVRRELG